MQKLAEKQAENEKILADFKEAQEKMTEQLKLAQGTARQSRIEKEAAEMVASGIPPVMVESWKTLANMEMAQSVIKLSNQEGSEIETTQADAMKEMLLSMPQDSRVQFGQSGATAPIVDEEKVRLACDEDIRAMGGTVTEDGKYKL